MVGDGRRNRGQDRNTLGKARAAPALWPVALVLAVAIAAPGLAAEAALSSPSPELRPGYFQRPLSTARDESRAYFETGRRLFEEKRFGEALPAFQAAVAEREQHYGLALADMDSLLAERESARAKGSLAALLHEYAKRDLPAYRLGELESQAGSSLVLFADLLVEERLDADFSRFLKALLLVLDKKSASELKDKTAELRKACLDLQSYPEAEYWIGRVYEAEGETRLAEFQYRRAWDQRASLDIPDEGFDYLGELALLFRTQENFRAYEDVLQKVMAEDPLYGESRRFYREGMERSLGREGFDKFFSLYRVSWGPWTAYELELGRYYLGNGRPQALGLLAAGVDALATRCVWRINQKDRAWEYKNLSGFLDAIAKDGEVQEWAAGQGFYQSLHELGLALDAGGYRESAREIWKELAARPYLEPWAKASSRALAAAAPKK